MEDHEGELTDRTIKPHNTGENVKIPVIKEKLSISTEENITGEVQVRKVVQTEEVDIPLTTVHTRYREERIPVDRVVETVPQIRYAGDNLIIPVVREEEVVVKRLVLVEEIHLIREQSTEERIEHVELRTEQATVQHKNSGSAPGKTTE